MKYKLLLCSLFVFVGCTNDGMKGEKYGDKITLNSITSLKSILQQPEDNKGKEFLISGTMINVCQKKGCWMSVKDEDDFEIFVRFKDYGFFMPKDGFGRKVRAQGIYSNSFEKSKDENGKEVELLAHLFTASGVVLD
ncbi:MAG: DUF4920 domain-containing protein [Candidatus Marinimicrobia bacterium]|nr:DUF4920 domain-containing protein [Candidatus Neomarinimicrobiota bacterium]